MIFFFCRCLFHPNLTGTCCLEPLKRRSKRFASPHSDFTPGRRYVVWLFKLLRATNLLLSPWNQPAHRSHSGLLQPNYDQLEKEVDRRKVFLAEAKLKAKGLNPDGTPALSTLGGFSPASKPCSPNVVKVEEKSPNPQAIKPVKKEPDTRNQVNKSPHNG